ncbi:MAG TPA: acyltransferase family protein [Xanthobacteraceae bacterium]|nr:acyltransferase family protein [Xanthobacteraceae bacterium]
MTQRATFRADINALRALAVAMVALYHFDVPGFELGFIGVDIFFVVSGYLMTQILLGRIDTATFSLLDFYVARARRIVPALLFLCLVLLGLGWFLLMPSDYANLGKQAAASSTFISNIVYWRENSYFAEASNYKWLLHTWSLSIEWQFYLIYPLVLAGMVRLGLKRAAIVELMWLAFLASLALCLYSSNANPKADFFLLPTRGWELLAGGLAYVHGPGARWSRWGSYPRFQQAGFALILLSLVVAHEQQWPNATALVPVIGTLLVVLGGDPPSRLTRNRVVMAIGLWSYSIYLWHWPVRVGLRFADLGDNALASGIGLLVSVGLGYLSYRFIEQPAQRILARSVAWRPIVALSAPALGLLAVGVTIWDADGVSWRMPPAVNIADAATLDLNPYRKECLADSTGGHTLGGCVIGQGQPIRAVVWGDSHADAVVTAVADSLDGRGGVQFFGLSNCPSALGTGNRPGLDCTGFNNKVVQRLEKSDPGVPLFIVNRLEHYLRPDEDEAPQRSSAANGAPAFDDPILTKFAATACRIAAKRPVFVLRPIPDPGFNVPRRVAGEAMWTDKPADPSFRRQDYDREFRAVNMALDAIQRSCGVIALDAVSPFCAEGTCRLAQDGRPFFYDDDHLNEFGNNLLVPAFRSAILDTERRRGKAPTPGTPPAAPALPAVVQ